MSQWSLRAASVPGGLDGVGTGCRRHRLLGQCKGRRRALGLVKERVFSRFFAQVGPCKGYTLCSHDTCVMSIPRAGLYAAVAKGGMPGRLPREELNDPLANPISPGASDSETRICAQCRRYLYTATCIVRELVWEPRGPSGDAAPSADGGAGVRLGAIRNVALDGGDCRQRPCSPVVLDCLRLCLSW